VVVYLPGKTPTPEFFSGTIPAQKTGQKNLKNSAVKILVAFSEKFQLCSNYTRLCAIIAVA